MTQPYCDEADESWADAFAAAVLMPADAIISMHARGMTAPEIARCLHVTIAAVVRRLAGLGFPGDGNRLGRTH